MEAEELLDPDSELHLYALHYIFIPRINKLLNDFSLSWNNHPLRTEKNQTPIQLWSKGFFETENLIHETEINFDEYGVDEYGPELEIQTNNDVQIPEIETELTNEEEQYIVENFDPLENDGTCKVSMKCPQYSSQQL